MPSATEKRNSDHKSAEGRNHSYSLWLTQPWSNLDPEASFPTIHSFVPHLVHWPTPSINSGCTRLCTSHTFRVSFFFPLSSSFSPLITKKGNKKDEENPQCWLSPKFIDGCTVLRNMGEI